MGRATVGAVFVKSGNDAQGRVVICDAITNDNITGLGIPEQDTTYEPVTSTVDGLMLAADKVNLDSIVFSTDAEVTAACTEVFGA